MRPLRAAALAVTALSLVLLLAGAVQIALGGMAVKRHYDEVAARQVETGYNRYDPYAVQQYEMDRQYGQSSTAYLTEGAMTGGPALPGWRDPAGIAAIVLGVAALGFFAATLVWVWRAHANIAAHGIRARFTPGKALAAWLIPIANLVLPFEAMRELYNRSHGEPEELVGAPVDDVTAWWSAVVIGMLIFSALSVKFILDLGTAAYIMTPLWMEYVVLSFAILLLLGSAFLFSRLARAITRAQEEVLPTLDPVAVEQAVPTRPSVRVLGGHS